MVMMMRLRAWARVAEGDGELERLAAEEGGGLGRDCQLNAMAIALHTLAALHPWCRPFAGRRFCIMLRSVCRKAAAGRFELSSLPHADRCRHNVHHITMIPSRRWIMYICKIYWLRGFLSYAIQLTPLSIAITAAHIRLITNISVYTGNNAEDE